MLRLWPLVRGLRAKHALSIAGEHKYTFVKPNFQNVCHRQGSKINEMKFHLLTKAKMLKNV